MVVISPHRELNFGAPVPVRDDQPPATPLEQLEALAEALLDFTGPADLDAWLAAHT